MSSSHKKINYKLRAAKTVERKMMAELIKKSANILNISDYEYIGFGSIYFADFSLFHRSIGIDKMTSIELNEMDKSRFEFNKPYSCITIEFGHSNKVLPLLGWKAPAIVWLDYDGKIESSVIQDINTFCVNAPFNSFLFITLNIKIDDPSEGEKKIVEERGEEFDINQYRYQKLVEAISENKIPIGITGKDLNKIKIANVTRKIILNEINEALNIRNGVSTNNNESLIFQPLINFLYEDGVRMLTVGGALISNKQKTIINKSAFQEFSFISDDEAVYEIDVPNLTINEISYLNTVIHDIINFQTWDIIVPVEGGQKLNKTQIRNDLFKAIPESEVKKYARVYKYYPTFIEAFI